MYSLADKQDSKSTKSTILTKFFLIIPAFLCLSFFSAHGTTIYVDSTANGLNNGTSWVNAYVKLDAALNQAVSGDTIKVAKGTYFPDTTGLSDHRTATFNLPDSVVLFGGYPAGGGARNWKTNQTILNGDIGVANDSSDNCFRVVYGHNLSDQARLDGFYVTDAYAENATDGAGVFLDTADVTLVNLVISNNVFISNSAVAIGGGIRLNNSSSLIMNVLLYNNQVIGFKGMDGSSGTKGADGSPGGGCGPSGPGGAGSAGSNGTDAMDGGKALGGGMYVFGNSNPTAVNLLFIENIVEGGDGGQGGDGGDGGAGGEGGCPGGCLSGGAGGDGGKGGIGGNGGAGGVAYGGGLYCETDSKIELVNSTFYRNLARGGRGGTAGVGGTGGTGGPEGCGGSNGRDGDDGSNGASGSAGTRGSAYGGGSFAQPSGEVIVSNSIFWKNKKNNLISDFSGDVTATYCLLHSAGGVGCLTGEKPEFQNESLLSGHDGIWITHDDGLRINACSPAINAGLNDSIPLGIMTDLLDTLRVMDDTVDMGAFETPFTKLHLVYVDSAARGSSTGESWANAYTDLQKALCTNADTILVAKGTYYPSGSNRTASFNLPDSTVLLGGYPSGGGTRNWNVNLSILSGDIGTPNDTVDNSYTVLYFDSMVNHVVLDGFIIEGGHANGAAAQWWDKQSCGGGIYLDGRGAGNNSSPQFSNLTIRNNYARNGGSVFINALDTGSANPIFTNVIFYGNSAETGGAIHAAGDYSGNADFAINQCLFYDNDATSQGGAIVNQALDGSAIANIKQSTLAFNDSLVGHGILNHYNGGKSVISNSIVWDTLANHSTQPGSYTYTYSLIASEGHRNPQFLDPVSYDFRIDYCSPAAGGGYNDSIPAGTTHDLNDTIRIKNGIVDMGVYESVYLNLRKIYVDSAATGTNTGESWANAFTDLQDASHCTATDTIFVAKGTYKPATYDRDSSFSIWNNVVLLGGYPNGGGSRSWKTNRTILSGDIGMAGSDTDNSYTVVYFDSTVTNSVLDGFIIEHGNADSSYFSLSPTFFWDKEGAGGGIYLDGEGSGNECSPIISNCVIRNNNGLHGGGMFANGRDFGKANPILRNCTFYENTTSLRDGAAIFVNGRDNGQSNPKIHQCLFYNNNSAEDGSALFIYSRYGGEARTEVKQSTFFNTTAASMLYANYVGSEINMDNSIAWGRMLSGNSATQSNTFSIIKSNDDPYPQFVDTTKYNFQLSACSPAIDKGQNDSIPSTINFDMTEAQRVQGDSVDMGAYEGGELPNNIITLADTTQTANGELTDADGWTHYCFCDTTDNSNSTWLLSLKKNSNNIGKVGDGTFSLKHTTSGKYNTDLATELTSAPYVTADSFFVFNRYWEVVPTSQPVSSVNVRFPYSTADFTDLQASMPVLANHTEMAFFKVDGAHNPHSLSVPASHYHEYKNGTSPSLTDWLYTDYTAIMPGVHIAEYLVSSFSGGGGGSGNGVNGGALPVELLTFQARWQENKKDALLYWRTALELHSSHFEIERSLDGLVWNYIGELPGNTVPTYTYQDHGVALKIDENVYYRLKQVDYDGTFEYSKVVGLSKERVPSLLEVFIFPNPVRDELHIVPHYNSYGKLKMTNALGKHITELQINGRTSIDVSRLPNGVYYLYYGEKVEKVLKF